MFLLHGSAGIQGQEINSYHTSFPYDDSDAKHEYIFGYLCTSIVIIIYITSPSEFCIPHDKLLY